MMVTQGGSCVVFNFPFTSYIWSTFEKTFPTHDARCTTGDYGRRPMVQEIHSKTWRKSQTLGVRWVVINFSTKIDIWRVHPLFIITRR